MPMYEHLYKYGKQKAIMTVDEFKDKLEASLVKLEQKAFLVILWHSGVRKSEAYERVKEDIEITEKHVIVDFHQRKKHGETVPPLKIPRKFYGVEEYLVPYLLKAKRVKSKTIYSYETVEGKLVRHSRARQMAFQSHRQLNSMANMQEGFWSGVLSALFQT